MVAVNVPLAQLLGVHPPTLEGRSIGELLPTGGARVVMDAATNLRDAPRSMDVMLAIGGQDLHGRLTLGPGPTASTLVLVFADHTVLHEERSALRASLSAAAAAARNVGDDLQAELTVVAGYSRMLAHAGDVITATERMRLHERIAEAAQRAAGLSRDRGPETSIPTAAPPASLTDVMAWVEQATALRLADAAAVLVWDIDRQVDVDTGVLRQVLVGLVVDALERSDEPRQHVHVTMRPVADGLEVIVSDSAHHEDELARILDDTDEPPPAARSLATERALATSVGGWLSAVPSTDGTRHVLWMPARHSA